MLDHQSLLAWKEARTVALQVLAISRTSWKPWAAAVFGQLQRASLSVQLNIAEGYALRGSRRHVYHLWVAYGSAVETGDLLELLETGAIVSVSDMGDVRERNDKAQKLLWGLIKRRSNEGDRM